MVRITPNVTSGGNGIQGQLYALPIRDRSRLQGHQNRDEDRNTRVAFADGYFRLWDGGGGGLNRSRRADSSRPIKPKTETNPPSTMRPIEPK